MRFIVMMTMLCNILRPGGPRPSFIYSKTINGREEVRLGISYFMMRKEKLLLLLKKIKPLGERVCENKIKSKMGNVTSVNQGDCAFPYVDTNDTATCTVTIAKEKDPLFLVAQISYGGLLLVLIGIILIALRNMNPLSLSAPFRKKVLRVLLLILILLLIGNVDPNGFRDIYSFHFAFEIEETAGGLCFIVALLYANEFIRTGHAAKSLRMDETGLPWAIQFIYVLILVIGYPIISAIATVLTTQFRLLTSLKGIAGAFALVFLVISVEQQKKIIVRTMTRTGTGDIERVLARIRRLNTCGVITAAALAGTGALDLMGDDWKLNLDPFVDLIFWLIFRAIYFLFATAFIYLNQNPAGRETCAASKVVPAAKTTTITSSASSSTA